MNTFLIWWTNQHDCEEVGSYRGAVDVPDYISSEFRSRYGRPGRGRLWIPNSLSAEVPVPPISIPFPETPLANVLGNSYGGIVIRARDVECLRDLPGVITDLAVRRIEVSQ
jgi:hypothetical protein